MKPKKFVNILLGVIVLISTGPACIISSSPGSSPQAPSQQPGLPIATLPEGDTAKPPGLGSITFTSILPARSALTITPCQTPV